MEKNRIISHFTSFLHAISERPGMFNVKDVEDINLIVFGYKNGCSLLKAEDAQILEEWLLNFRKFINEEFESKENYDWPRLIKFYAGGSLNSIDLFKEKLKKFILIE